MTLAFIKTEVRGQTDLLLAAFAEYLQQRGKRLCGVVQTNTDCAESELCDMDVRVLPDGPVFRISQSLGAGSRGCRLDPTALEQSVAHVSPMLTGAADLKPDLMIVNKFGKHESDGRGFRPLIAEAMMAEIPVLTAVNSTNEAAFREFSGDMAQCIPARLSALQDWFEQIYAPAETAV